MRSYYKKDEKSLSIKNLVINDKKIKEPEFIETIIKKDVLYYDNIFGAIKRFSDDKQTLTREEAYDLIEYYIRKSEEPEKLVGAIDITFIDTSTRFPINISKNELKTLKKEKKIQKAKKRSTK